MATTQVLARKWRPKSFPELTGQEHVVRALSNALDSNRLHHAYLFTGTRGVGKTTIARILAKALNCETGVTALPCGVCPACVEIDSGRFVDLIELDAASNTGIDNMREVLDNAQYRPTTGRFKVYIIDEVHMLSTKAFNSMLKTLEEPPEHVKFILATTDPQKIPVTVLSRCLQFNLKQIPESLIRERLAKVLGQEAIEYEIPALSRIARAAQGSMRDALSLLDQAIAYSGGKVEETVVREMLGAIDRDYLFSILARLAENDGPGLIEIAEQMEGRSLSFEMALQELGSTLHQIALAQIVPQAISEDLPEREQLFELSRRFHPEAIQLLYQIALNGRAEIGLAPDEYSGFSMTLLRMLAFVPESNQPRPEHAEAGTREARPAPARIETPQASEPASRPSAAAPAAAAARDESGGRRNRFSGDWIELVGSLKLSGMAKMLAQHSAAVRFDQQSIELAVEEEHRHLMDKSYQDRVRDAVSEFLGGKIELKFVVGGGVTPAHVQNQQKEARQADAVAAIESDPVVRALVENFGANLIESSIKPI